MPKEIKLDMMITYAKEFMKAGHQPSPAIKLNENIEMLSEQ